MCCQDAEDSAECGSDEQPQIHRCPDGLCRHQGTASQAPARATRCSEAGCRARVARAATLAHRLPAGPLASPPHRLVETLRLRRLSVEPGTSLQTLPLPAPAWRQCDHVPALCLFPAPACVKPMGQSALLSGKAEAATYLPDGNAEARSS